MAATNEKELSMKWYKFQISFALIAGAVLNALNALLYITGLVYPSQTDMQVTAEQVYNYYGTGMQVLDITYGVLLIAMAVFGILVRQKLAKYQPDAPKLACIFYALIPAVVIAYTAISVVITSESDVLSQSAVNIALTFTMAILNIKYFKKRAFLFTGKPPVQNDATMFYQPAPPAATQAASFCIHCGTPIGAGDAFCMNCGTKVN